MKTRISLVLLLVLIGSFASATDKYVSTEFGFAASFAANVVRSQVTPDAASFYASVPGGAWAAQVKVTKNAVMPSKLTHEVMEAKLAEVL